MITNIKSILTIPLSRINSNRILTKPAIRSYKNVHQVIAQGHDKNIFSDVDVGGTDATTFEMLHHNHAHENPPKKRLKAITVSGDARNKANKQGHITVAEAMMPYGVCAKQDKQKAQDLLAYLQEKHQHN